MDNKIGIISDWIYVYKKYIPLNVLENELIYETIQKDNGYDIKVKNYLYECIDDNIVMIPRYCKTGLQLYNNEYLIDERTIGEDINININVEPRDEHQKYAIEALLNNDNGIVHAKTAFGKTYVAINVIATLKKKALILMHKRELMNQWKDDILKYTDLKDEDVQIFTGNETKFKEGKAITITTVQNLYEKIRSHNNNIRKLFQKENFGITFYDECHTTVGPYMNTMASKFIFSKRLYGLSATPKRGDSCDIAIKYILGDVIFNDERKMLPVYIAFAPVQINVPESTRRYLSRFKNTFTLRYSNWLVKNEKYVDYCTNIIYSLIKINKKILAVAQYKNILETIYNSVYSILGDNKDNVDKIKIVHGSSKGKLKDIKNMNEEQLNNFNCIFTTTSFFSAGLSINWLDTIVYLTPPSPNSLSAIPQLIGRIVRDYKNKNYVNVIDIYNKNFSIDEARMKKRNIAYKNFNYIVLPISDNVISNTDEYINTMIKMCDTITNYNKNKYSYLEEVIQ